MLISEITIGPSREAAAQVQGLFAGVKTDHLLGLLWFDEEQNEGVYHQDWRLENDPAALAAFRKAAQ